MFDNQNIRVTPVCFITQHSSLFANLKLSTTYLDIHEEVSINKLIFSDVRQSHKECRK